MVFIGGFSVLGVRDIDWQSPDRAMESGIGYASLGSIASNRSSVIVLVVFPLVWVE
jgi:hypothetical protein